LDLSKKPSIEAERKGKKDYTGKQWTKELIEFFWTHGNTLGKIGAKWHMPLTKTAPATPTFAYDKRLNTEFKWFTRTPR
jgi:hypothetical protein